MPPHLSLDTGQRRTTLAYWEGHWDTSAPGDVVPDSIKAAQAYKHGGSNAKCAARLDALRAR